jgi:hypothetical protein
MVTFVVNRKGKIAAEIFDQLAARLGAAAASIWMLSPCDDLNGMSPIQAIKAGRQQEVRVCAVVLVSRSFPLAMQTRRHDTDLSSV